MPSMIDVVADVFRDSEVAGLPASGEHDPVKAEIRSLLTQFVTTLSSFGIAGAVTTSRQTLALLNAYLTPGDGTFAFVWGDSTAANNGIYIKSGATGVGQWNNTGLIVPATIYAQIAILATAYDNISAYIDTAIAAMNAAAASAIAAAASKVGTAADKAATAADVIATAANKAATDLLVATAAAYANAAGLTKVFDTHALAVAGVAGIAANAYVQVLVDEDHSNMSTVYQKSGGVLVYKMSLYGITQSVALGDTIRSVSSDAAAAQLVTQVPTITALKALDTNIKTAYLTQSGYEGTFTLMVGSPPVTDGGESNYILSNTASRYWERRAKPQTKSLLQDIHPCVIDLHFGIQRGLCFLVGEPGGNTYYTVANAAAAGAKTITFTGTMPLAGQLLAYKGTDNNYYSIGVESVAGAVATFYTPLEIGVAIGVNVAAWFANFSHPGDWGAYSITDYVVRNGVKSKRLIYRRAPTIVAPSTIAAKTTASGLNPGSATVPAWSVTSSTAGYVKWVWTPPKVGRYQLSFRCRKIGTTYNEIVASVSDGVAQTFPISLQARDASRQTFDFMVSSVRAFTIKFASDADDFDVSELEIYEYLGGAAPDLNVGRHVYLGDSWVAQFPIADRAQTVLPNATVIKKGVPGNTVAQEWARFYTDVAPQTPDYVHIIGGTNDWYTGVAPEGLSYYAGRIINACIAIGAVPIFYTPSVASAGTDAAQFDLSRRYQREAYLQETKAPLRNYTRYNVSAYVPAGATVVLASFGVRETSFDVVSSFISHDTIIVQKGDQPTTGGTTILSIASGWNTTRVTAPTVLSNFKQLLHTNGTGAAYTVSGWIDVEDV